MKAFHKTMVAAGLCVSMAMGMTGCGSKPVEGSQVVATVGDKEMKLGEANFLLRYQQVQTEGYYESILGPDIYKKDLYGDGTTFGENFKEDVMNQMQEFYILEQKAADYGVALTEEETGKITETAKAFLEANEQATKEQMTADQATVERVLTLMTLSSKVKDAVYEEADVTVTDEEAAQRGFSYISVSKGTGENALTKEELSEKKEALSSIAEKVEGGVTLENAAVEMQMTAQSGNYGKEDPGYYEEALIQALDGLNEGEVSEVIETENYLYLAQLTAELDKKATVEKKESLTASRQAEYYKELLETWRLENPLTIEEDVWDQIVFDRSYDLKQQ